MFDLVIRGGSIVDGTGADPIVADVAITDGRIVAVERHVADPGRREIDAGGLHVTPGFVDVHTHYDGQATWDAELSPSSDHGVTSVVMGNCGVGFAPAHADAHSWLIDLLEGVEDIPGTALHEGIAWDWESFPDYLDALDRRSFAIDVGAYVGHAPLRIFEMGRRGGDPDEEPTDDELAAMADHLRRSVRAGALGFATSRTVAHKTKAGVPVNTLRAGERELLAITDGLAGTAAVMQLVSDAYRSDDDEFVGSELSLLTSVASAMRRPIALSLMQTDWAPDRWREVMTVVDGLNARGLDIKVQIAPRPVGVIQSLQSSLNPFSDCPSYRAIADQPLTARLALMRDPERRRQILSEHVGSAERVRNALLSDFDKMFPLGDPVNYEPDPGESLAALAASRGQSPAEATYDYLVAGAGTSMIYMPIFNWANRNLDDVREMLLAPNAMIGLSDGGAHCQTICDASFPTTLLSHWVRDRRAGQLSLPFVVRHLTQRTAAFVGWHDRGVIAPGYVADVNLIDLEAMALHAPRIVADLPAGGRRLLQRASGYVATIKRGEVIVEHGEHTGARPGQLVRGAQPAPAA